MISFFVPDDQNKNRVIEGFEPAEVVQEVVVRNILQMMDIIVKAYPSLFLKDKDYSNQMQMFSDEIIGALKNLVGECIYEVSEGLNEGLVDYEVIFKQNINSLLQKTVGPEMAMFAIGMLAPQLWDQFKKSYLNYKTALEVTQFPIDSFCRRNSKCFSNSKLSKKHSPKSR